jgi:poly(beta-D-mannuronate) lyase
MPGLMRNVGLFRSPSPKPDVAATVAAGLRGADGGRIPMLAGTVLALGFVLLASSGAAVAATGFSSPLEQAPGLRRAVKPTRSCAPVPPPVRDLVIESIFVRGQWNDKIPERIAARQAATKPLHDYLAKLVEISNRAMELPPASRTDEVKCALAWMSEWAQGGALMGNVVWPEGQYERKWTLITLSMAYLQLYAGAADVPVPPKPIADWLREMTRPLAEQYPEKDNHKQNHFYWAGLASMYAGTVLKDKGFYDWGVHRVEAGILAIDQDGFLPLELERGKLALSYHAFSASALVQAAMIDKANGGHLLSDNHDGITRLARRVFAGLADPSIFETKAGTVQSQLSRGDKNSLGWIEVYYHLTRDPQAEPWIRALRPFDIIWLGGNISDTFGVPIGGGPVGSSPLFSQPQ